MTGNNQYQSKQKLIGLLLCLFSTTAFAASGNIYLGGSMGASLAKVGSGTRQITYDGGKLTDAYPIDGKHATAPLFSLNAGYEFMGDYATTMPAIALGVGVYSTLGSNLDFNGNVTETAAGDPGTTLYNYKYNVSSTRVMAEAQFSWLLGRFAPFINGGAGTAWNHASGYSETPTTKTGFVALAPFQSHTNTNFAWQAGFGVSYVFNFNKSKARYWLERISIGYRYAHLGEASFGTRGTAYPYSLNTGTLTSNEIYLSYTHLF